MIAANAAQEPKVNESCPHCGQASPLRVLSRGAWGDRPAFVLLRCKRCELVYYSSRAEDFVPALYDYYQNYGDAPREVLFNQTTTISHRAVLASMAELVSGRRMLDLGCGVGHFVDSARSEGWDARGIDLSEPAIRVAKRLGVPCEHQDFFSAALDGDRFDLIIMSEFIEHVSQPGRFFERAEQLLAPGGVVYLTTPNFDSLSRYVLQEELSFVIHPEHLLYFTRRSLERVIRDSCGLEVVRVESKNFAVSEVATTLWTNRVAPLTKPLSALRRAPGGADASGSSAASSPSANAVAAGRKLDQRLRSFVRQSSVGAKVLSAANAVLSTLGVGDSLVAVLRKR